MEMRLVLPVLVLAAVASQLPSAAVAANYTVGDEKGWNPDVDYTAWVKKHKPFHKGDWLGNYSFFFRAEWRRIPALTSIWPKNK
jgi:hypothetical protein